MANTEETLALILGKLGTLDSVQEKLGPLDSRFDTVSDGIPRLENYIGESTWKVLDEAVFHCGAV